MSVPNKKPLPTSEKLMALVEYDPATGIFLWKTRVPEMFAGGRYGPDRKASIWNAKYARKEAFTAAQGNGGRQAVIGNSHYAAHRVAWKFVYGDEPEKIVAINGDLADCRIENLSAVPHKRTERPPLDEAARRIEARCVLQPNGCLEWTGSRNNKGYGVGWDGLRRGYTHRILYEARIGPIPEGLELDHLCRNPRCCNPAHLEPVTHSENARRGLTGAHLTRQRRAERAHLNASHILDKGESDSGFGQR